jgi:hypothetical protein
LLGSQIVGNYLDLTTCRLAIHDLGQKIVKLRTGVAGAGFSQHLSRFECSERRRVRGFHGGSTQSHAVQRGLEKAAKPDPGDPAPGWRSSESTQKTAACAGSFEVQANDVRRFPLQTPDHHWPYNQLRDQCGWSPNCRHTRLADTHLLGKAIATPMGRSVRWPAPGQLQKNARLSLCSPTPVRGSKATPI